MENHKIMQSQSPRLLIIEEPEAHLIPDDQKAIFESIIKCVNATHSKVLITTHAPHLLSTANNLLKAHEYGYEPLRSKAICFDDINVQKLDEGVAESILSTEHKLVNGGYMEKAFYVVTDEFSKIVNSGTKHNAVQKPLIADLSSAKGGNA